MVTLPIPNLRNPIIPPILFVPKLGRLITWSFGESIDITDPKLEVEAVPPISMDI
jgi:hypothetical protein